MLQDVVSKRQRIINQVYQGDARSCRILDPIIRRNKLGTVEVVATEENLMMFGSKVVRCWQQLKASRMSL